MIVGDLLGGDGGGGDGEGGVGGMRRRWGSGISLTGAGCGCCVGTVGRLRPGPLPEVPGM